MCVCVFVRESDLFIYACIDSFYRKKSPFVNFKREIFSFMQLTNPCLVIIGKLKEQI
jgi:hypothetical protein